MNISCHTFYSRLYIKQILVLCCLSCKSLSWVIIAKVKHKLKIATLAKILANSIGSIACEMMLVVTDFPHLAQMVLIPFHFTIIPFQTYTFNRTKLQ